MVHPNQYDGVYEQTRRVYKRDALVDTVSKRSQLKNLNDKSDWKEKNNSETYSCIPVGE